MSNAPEGEQALLFPAPCFMAMLRFLHHCSDAEHTLDASKAAGAEAPPGTLHCWRMLLEHGLARDGTWALHATAAQGLLDLASSFPKVKAAVQHDIHGCRRFRSDCDAVTIPEEQYDKLVQAAWLRKHCRSMCSRAHCSQSCTNKTVVAATVDCYCRQVATVLSVMSMAGFCNVNPQLAGPTHKRILLPRHTIITHFNGAEPTDVV